MDIEKLIRRLRNDADAYRNGETLGRAFADQEDVLDNAATALSALQDENAQLRESRDHWKRLAHELSEGVIGKDAEHERLQAENEKLRTDVVRLNDLLASYQNVLVPELRAELEQVTLENNALWTYIEIVDREYRRYMDRGYIDRLDELRKTWKCGQKED